MGKKIKFWGKTWADTASPCRSRFFLHGECCYGGGCVGSTWVVSRDTSNSC